MKEPHRHHDLEEWKACALMYGMTVVQQMHGDHVEPPWGVPGEPSGVWYTLEPNGDVGGVWHDWRGHGHIFRGAPEGQQPIPEKHMDKHGRATHRLNRLTKEMVPIIYPDTL